MSWPMQNPGQWNPGMGMTPDMNMASYTADQWTAMQQQNWQQWAQWQQQYAQWQSQYGEKYAEQMQAMQGAPPLPPRAAPPPAPPPPDAPPPPPPHENDQPLYAKPVPVPAPVKAPPASVPAGNASSWPPERPDTQPNLVNSEALKKLAEEERLFDIQFQKWEEEIQKWKRENVNHPDKQAYQDYEEKFEACRAQLLERRQQMNQKRARLLGNQPAAPPQPAPANNISMAMPPPLIKNNYTNNSHAQSQNYNNSSQNYYDNKNQQQQYKAPLSRYDKSMDDPQDRYNSYNNMEDYSTGDKYVDDSNKPTFLPTISGGKGIPGLDLVPETEKPKPRQYNVEEVIDITEDPQQRQPPKRPDLSSISKGINNILGDEKIMNILSMVRGQGGQGAPAPLPNNQQAYMNKNMNMQDMYGESNNHMQNNQWDRNSEYNQQQQYNNRQMPPNRQGPNQNYPPYNNQYYNENEDEQVQHHDDDMYSMSHRGASRGTGGPPRRHDGLGSEDRNMPQPMNQHMNQPRINQPPPLMSQPISQPVMNQQPPPPRNMRKWVDEPMFTPSLLVEYEHKPLRLKARDFIEPVHMFDYNHLSKDGENKKKHYENAADEWFSRKPRRPELEDVYSPDRFGRERESSRFSREYDHPPTDRYSRDQPRQYERRPPRDDYRPRVPSRDEYQDRRYPEDRFDDRKYDDRDRTTRRDDMYKDRERDREDSIRERDRVRELDVERDRNRDSRRDNRNRSRSRDRDIRKRGRSKESVHSDVSSSKKTREQGTEKIGTDKHIVMIDDILEPPGRDMRPQKIVIILRGPPGSGKSYLAKLIRDREAEFGGTSRIMSLDDYFMQEGEIEEKDPATGKTIKKPSLKYEYDASMEESYTNSLKRAFKRSITDGYFSFLIMDAVNEHLKCYADIWNYARQNGFQVYVCTLELDANVCHKRNIHNRTLDDIQVITSRFFPTPPHHIQLDPTTLLQSAAITDVHMEDAVDEVIMEDVEETEVESVFTSKWEKMDDAAQLARLDGTNKPLRPSHFSMEDYLQLDEWKPTTAKPGKKTVRWADIEERREQEKMRAIGFVVGQTDWNRMTDPTMGSSALTQTKYIERVRRM